MAAMAKVRITQVKSVICTKEAHRRTLKALGLSRINNSVEKTINPAVQGMINAVSYLIKVEEVE